MPEQHIFNHFNQIDFWHNLLLYHAHKQLDWCDCLAIQMIIERINGMDQQHIDELIMRNIDDALFRSESISDSLDTTPEVPPAIEAVTERANELTDLYLKVEAII
jgi:hypothetical protein